MRSTAVWIWLGVAACLAGCSPPPDGVPATATDAGAQDTADAGPADSAHADTAQADSLPDAAPADAPAAVTHVFDDDFAGSTLHPDRWVEFDSAPGGKGATTGNVQQHDGLFVTGANLWGANGIRSKATFDRALGDIAIDADLVATACGTVYGYAMGYGEPGYDVTGRAYVVFQNQANWNLVYTDKAGGAQVSVGFAFKCTDGKPFHMRLVVREGAGAALFIGDDPKPAAELAQGSFSDAPVWFQHYSLGTTAAWHHVHIESIQGLPDAPTQVTAKAGVGTVSLAWARPRQNGSAIGDYRIETSCDGAPFAVWPHAPSPALTATLDGLVAGVPCVFRIAAVNASGTGANSAPVAATPVTLTPAVPLALQVTTEGSPTQGELLTGTYLYSDANGDPAGVAKLRWLRAAQPQGPWQPIAGQTGASYLLALADVGQYVAFEVTPESTQAPFTGLAVQAQAVGPILPAPNYLNHILSTGQSLSVGVNGKPALSTTQPFENVMLDAANHLTPLLESIEESPASAMGNGITALVKDAKFQVAVTRHGVPATGYAGLKKGSNAYAVGLQQILAVHAAAQQLGRPSRVLAVTTVHGEADEASNSGAQYATWLAQWQADYEADVHALTGQTGIVPLFTCQTSSHTGAYQSANVIPIAQLEASETHPDRIFLIGPKYFLDYFDNLHLKNTSYRLLGEYYARAIHAVTVAKTGWQPLSPVALTRTGADIDVQFHVPAPPLAFDTVQVLAQTHMGFEYWDDAGSATIASVAITGPHTVRVTLSQTPTGKIRRLRYAWTGTPGAKPGAHSPGSARGNLRDSDTTVSLSGTPLVNWAVHFDKPVP